MKMKLLMAVLSLAITGNVMAQSMDADELAKEVEAVEADRVSTAEQAKKPLTVNAKLLDEFVAKTKKDLKLNGEQTKAISDIYSAHLEALLSTSPNAVAETRDKINKQTEAQVEKVLPESKFLKWVQNIIT